MTEDSMNSSNVRSVKELGQIGAKGAKATLKNGKIMLQGVKGGFAKGAKSLDDLARQLVGKLRFNKYKIRLQGRRIQLIGHINPWIVLADGSFAEVDSSEIPVGTNLGDELTTSLGKGKFVGHDIPDLLKGVPGSTLKKGNNFKDHFIRHKQLLEQVLGKKYPKVKTHADEFINDLTGMISSGRMKYTGISTLKNAADHVFVYRGDGLTAVFKLDGEWVTLLETGKGIDIGLDNFMIARP